MESSNLGWNRCGSGWSWWLQMLSVGPDWGLPNEPLKSLFRSFVPVRDCWGGVSLGPLQRTLAGPGWAGRGWSKGAANCGRTWFKPGLSNFGGGNWFWLSGKRGRKFSNLGGPIGPGPEKFGLGAFWGLNKLFLAEAWPIVDTIRAVRVSGWWPLAKYLFRLRVTLTLLRIVLESSRIGFADETSDRSCHSLLLIVLFAVASKIWKNNAMK